MSNTLDTKFAASSMFEEDIAVDTYTDRLNETTDEKLKSILREVIKDEKDHRRLFAEYLAKPHA